MYYNTNNHEGQMLLDFESQADSQEERILAIFKAKPSLAPSQVWNAYGNKRTPITSIRRAITNLSKEGRLIKTQEKQIGMFGRPESVYKLISA